METFLSRYKNLTALFAVVLLQLLLLAYQIKGDGDVRLIRVWAIGSVTPLARLFEAARTKTSGMVNGYFLLVGTHAENQRIQQALDRATMENLYLRSELSTADRAKALALFQERSPSKTIAARVIGNASGSATRVVILDRGGNSGIEKGMAVITPQGIVGKITGVYPNAAYVLLITDPSFGAGVVSQKSRFAGTMRGKGDGAPSVEHIPNERKIEAGEWFYTSGDDLIFPKGLPAGEVTSVSPGKLNQEIQIRPSGLRNGLEEVLVILSGVHGEIPDAPPANQPIKMMEPPPGLPADETRDPKLGSNAPPNAPAVNPVATAGGVKTDADRLLDQYRKIGTSLGHVFGQSSNGAPNYNVNLNRSPAPPVSQMPPPPKP